MSRNVRMDIGMDTYINISLVFLQLPSCTSYAIIVLELKKKGLVEKFWTMDMYQTLQLNRARLLPFSWSVYIIILLLLYHLAIILYWVSHRKIENLTDSFLSLAVAVEFVVCANITSTILPLPRSYVILTIFAVRSKTLSNSIMHTI